MSEDQSWESGTHLRDPGSGGDSGRLREGVPKTGRNGHQLCYLRRRLWAGVACVQSRQLMGVGNKLSYVGKRDYFDDSRLRPNTVKQLGTMRSDV